MNIELIYKSLGWRLIATGLTGLIAFLVTGSLGLAVSIGSVDTIAKLVAYYFYDLAWLKWLRSPLDAKVVWLTGLSGAGKTTIAEALAEKLRTQGQPVVILDGDYIRDIVTTGFDPASRKAHIQKVGQMAAILEAQGVTSIVSLISPYRSGRAEARGYAKNFIEVYLSTTLEVCQKRDVKGLYAKVAKGEIKNFTGVDAIYQEPKNPELILNTDELSLKKCVRKILAAENRDKDKEDKK